MLRQRESTTFSVCLFAELHVNYLCYVESVVEAVVVIADPSVAHVTAVAIPTNESQI